MSNRSATLSRTVLVLSSVSRRSSPNSSRSRQRRRRQPRKASSSPKLQMMWPATASRASFTACVRAVGTSVSVPHWSVRRASVDRAAA
eukprot:7489992-Pyramimonas_sp.AAC.1